MAKKYCHFVLLTAVVAVLTTVASANQVTIGNSTTGNLKFTNVHGDTKDVQFSFTGNCKEGGNNCVSGSKGIIACTCGRCTWVFRVHDTDLAAGQVAFDGHRCEDFPRAREALSTA